jgi:hypothetical protein
VLAGVFETSDPQQSALAQAVDSATEAESAPSLLELPSLEGSRPYRQISDNGSTFRHRRQTVEQRSIDDPNETRPYAAHGHMDVVTLGDFTLGRGTFEPGWQWSKDVKPIAGTESCMVRHTGICVSGKMTIRTNDGAEATISAGDVFLLEPGHDAWTVGDEPCILYDTGVAAYAKPTA